MEWGGRRIHEFDCEGQEIADSDHGLQITDDEISETEFSTTSLSIDWSLGYSWRYIGNSAATRTKTKEKRSKERNGEIQKMVRVWVGSQLEQTNKKGNFELKMVADTRQPPVNVQHIYLL